MVATKMVFIVEKQVETTRRTTCRRTRKTKLRFSETDRHKRVFPQITQWKYSILKFNYMSDRKRKPLGDISNENLEQSRRASDKKQRVLDVEDTVVLTPTVSSNFTLLQKEISHSDKLLFFKYRHQTSI
jgi:hypothetical protein